MILEWFCWLCFKVMRMQCEDFRHLPDSVLKRPAGLQMTSVRWLKVTVEDPWNLYARQSHSLFEGWKSWLISKPKQGATPQPPYFASHCPRAYKSPLPIKKKQVPRSDDLLNYLTAAARSFMTHCRVNNFINDYMTPLCLSFLGGSSTEGDGLFEGDYGGPPLPVTEGMQHIRIMEGVSRSLPSSPLLSHQALNMRLQPTKRLPGEESQELGPPPSVDEAANTLMTRLGFLLGDKMNEGQSGSQYDMDNHDDSQGMMSVTQRISPCSSLASSTASPPASSPCSTLPPGGAPGKHASGDCAYGSITSPTSTLESRDSGIIVREESWAWWENGGGD
ncbi:unnamed protein product [Oncorhynchus mykiss]|uniref:Uncharacterized protein n=1 Tax=Oncorhynchus mykiss TaxID=8022 RepID=A0A060WDX4_ONCMY|nr:unnamed protein product [Oncorhynchus mykiss]